MKTTLLTNLLIAFALGLCALCTFQWLRETETRREVQRLHDQVFQRDSSIQTHTNQIHHMDLQINELTADVAHLKSTVKTNEARIRDLTGERNELYDTNKVLTANLEAYTKAYGTLTNQLQKAYDDIRKQNEAIKEVVAQRDEFVAKLNESIEERNKVVGEYNKLVDQVKEIQDQVAQQNAKNQQSSTKK